MKAGADELRTLQPEIKKLGENPWELACILGGIPIALWICIVVGIALVIIFVMSVATK